MCSLVSYALRYTEKIYLYEIFEQYYVCVDYTNLFKLFHYIKNFLSVILDTVQQHVEPVVRESLTIIEASA